MELTQAQRDEMVERLIRDWCDTVTQWALYDQDSLYNFCASFTTYREMNNSDLIERYGDTFDELPEGIEDEDN